MLFSICSANKDIADKNIFCKKINRCKHAFISNDDYTGRGCDECESNNLTSHINAHLAGECNR